VLRVERVGAFDNFFSLGGHSLLAVQLMVKIKKEFGRSLPLSILFEGPTVEEMARILQLQAGGSSPSPLVGIRSGGSLPPFFFVHPVGGNVFCYYELANSLTPDWPVYGLQSRGLDNGQGPSAQIEEMAASYLEAIREVQPRGPYFLGGWSMGGVLAFDMAAQLRSQGESVALLALIDSWAPSAELNTSFDDAAVLTEFFLDLCGVQGRSLSASREALAAELRQLESHRQLEYLFDRARRQKALPADADASQLSGLLETFKANVQALRRYSPQSFDGRIALFRASDEQMASPDSSHGWASLARRVEVRPVPGDHYSMLAQPHVSTLAEEIGRYIDEAQAAGGPAQS
jgi:thioesterase domain-containing protein